MPDSYKRYKHFFDFALAKNFCFGFLFLLFIVPGAIAAQEQTSADTFQIARQLRTKGHYAKAVKLLYAYNKNHPKDANALWLLAQTEYWTGHLAICKKHYSQASILKPNDDYLQLDYGKALANMGEWKQSLAVLQKLESRGKHYSDEQVTKAIILYGQGDYKRAKQEIDSAIAAGSTTKQVWEFRSDIQAAAAPLLALSAAYTSDNQPLQSITPAADAAFFINPFARLDVGLGAPIFIANNTVSSAEWLQVGNKSWFQRAGFSLQEDVGIVRFPYHGKISWLGNIALSETVFKHLAITAQAEHRAYLNTLASLDTFIPVYHITSTIGWNDRSSINGQLGFDMNTFPDKNYVYALYGWLYAPPIRFSVVELRIGYGYSFSDSKSDKFETQESLAQIIANFTTTQVITGVYDPYFTPQKQQVHSALASLEIRPVKAVTIGFNANVGFYATTQTPYLFLDNDESGNTVIDRGFVKEKYTPYELSAFLNWKISKKVSLRANYAYRSTYFFNSNNASLSCKISFWHEKN
jgi:tetratricopeptide (TPR) repeat protein